MREIKLYLPTMDKERNFLPIATYQRIKESAIHTLNSLFGGCTAFQAIGHWINANGECLNEEVTVLCSYFPGEESTTKLGRIQALADYIRVELDQEAVLYTVQDVEIVEFVKE